MEEQALGESVFDVLFAQADQNHHLSYGMVELPEGKMKSREGTVVDADDLLLEMRSTARDISDELGKVDDFSEEDKAALARKVGHGALKYFLLKVAPAKSMMFDPKSSIDFFGNTAPFIQFNVVRCKSILRNTDNATSTLTWDQATPLDAAERQLAAGVLGFPDVVQEAAASYDPSLIANHCYDLIKAFSSFYQDHPIAKEKDAATRQARLGLTLVSERFRTAWPCSASTCPSACELSFCAATAAPCGGPRTPCAR